MRSDDLGTLHEVGPPDGGVGRFARALPRQAPGSDAPRHVAVVRPDSGRIVLLAPQAAAGPRPCLARVSHALRPRLLRETRGEDHTPSNRRDEPASAAPFTDARRR